jgi:PTH1 family peptidyl-tRNA hydrolase
VRLDPEWRGPRPPEAAINVIDRRGVDIAPLDPHDPDDALRLTSYLWPDQPWRIERAQAAIKLCDATVDKGDACDWLEQRLKKQWPGAIHMVTHTVAWQYFPEATRARCLTALEEAGARATREAPLARLSVEGDERKGEGAPIELTIWPGARSIKLGRVDFHGRWVDWNAPPDGSHRTKS